MKKLLVYSAALLSLIACTEQDIENAKENQILKNGSPQEISIAQPKLPNFQEDTIDKKVCTFENADDLKSYLQENIESQLSGLVEVYNSMFGMSVSPDDIKINYKYFNRADYPNPIARFHYDFDNNELLLEYAPSDTPDQFARDLCGKDSWNFDLYKGVSVGFTPHEVAHWYHGEFMKEKGISWKNIETGTPKNLGAFFVAEGIAVYLASMTDSDESSVGQDESVDPFTPVFANESFNKYIYPAAEKFSRPLLDKSFVQGVEYMSRNLPEPESTEELLKYQANLLQKL